MPLTSLQRISGIVAWFAVCFAVLALIAVCVSAEIWAGPLMPAFRWIPAWSPSGTVMLQAWTILFSLQAAAVWLVWLQREEPVARLGVGFFVSSLCLTLVWAVVRFVYVNALCGLIEVVVLWMAVLATMSLFYQRSRLAGLLMVPSFLWITFLAWLNFSIWLLNN